MAQQEKVWLSSPHMSGVEQKFVQEVFDTNWVSPVGPHINRFEQVLADYVGVGHCAALGSGTAAIHLALIILGVQREDEVICQSFTFSGSCNPIMYQGATPVFVDSEADTWNMDPALLRVAIQDRIKKTSRKPKAIIVVHLYGMPVKMDEIMAISREFQIPVIEDAAEALGSTYKGKKCGSFGDFGILSFNGNKIITTSGGGALLSNNEDWIKKSRFLATQAREPFPHYEHKEVGYNYRLSNVCAAIGLGQMTVIDDRVAKRREIFDFYRDGLADYPHIKFNPEPEDYVSNRWLSTILVDDSDNQKVTPESIRMGLDAVNIESRPLWKPMHLQPVFAGFPAYLSGVSERLFKTGLCLPSGSNMDTRTLNAIKNQLTDLVTKP
jgi:dTDP-4-amino-4,6-dideoxygalactose transaminase